MDKKSRDLSQAFEKLLIQINYFSSNNIAEGLERNEIESLILQITRLSEKLEKLRKIVGFEYKKKFEII